MLALDYSEARWQPLPIMVATTTAMITRRTPAHPRFGIGATRIRAITLRYRNVLFHGGKLFSKF